MVMTRIVCSVAAAALLGFARADVAYNTDLKSYQDLTLGLQPNQTFHSSSIVAPILQINRFHPDKLNTSAYPYIFTAGGWNSTWGSVIFSSKDLSVVYQDYTYDALAQGTHVWHLDGERVYAAIEGNAFRIFDQTYKQLYAVTPKGDLKGVKPDTHEGVITKNGTVLLIACPAETVDLSDHDGPKDAQILNCKIQEIDIKSNKVLFEFASLDYFDPYDSFIGYSEGKSWDYCHQNSVQKTDDGDFIASYRHLSAVIKIDGSTSKVKWVMGGKRNEFNDTSTHDGAAYFAYQHEARVWNGSSNRFTIFDNAQLTNNFCDGKNCSRGLELEYDEDKKTVKMVDEWYHPQSLISSSRGGVQKMDSGHTFIAWGQNYGFTEHDANGTCILDFQRGAMGIPGDVPELVTYRAWRDKWMPRPTWGPNVSAADNHIYVSWNGLMVADWLLLLSDSDSDLDTLDNAVARSPRNGFETSFDLADHSGSKFARVIGLQGNGSVLGATPVVEIESGALSGEDAKMKFSDTDGLGSVSTSEAVAVPTGDASTKQYPPPEVEEDNGDDGDGDDDSGAGRVGGWSMLCLMGVVVLLVM